MDSGRLSNEDVETALAYQRAHGGYFGEALVACGFASEGEVEWGLASQYDLPYVFPQAEAVDYRAASLVSPEWALAHLTLPIMMTDESLTVIVASPLDDASVGELRERTGLAVELALAAPSTIRELIREIYARGTAADEDAPGRPVELALAIDSALEAAAPRFGVSARGSKAWAWWDDDGTIRRRALAGPWRAELEESLAPAWDLQSSGASHSSWNARLTRAGIVTPVEVHVLTDESGSEYLFHPRHSEAAPRGRFAPPPEGIVSEVRLLARTGKARLVVTTKPVAFGHDVVPYLPELLFDPEWRSVFIHAEDHGAEAEVFSRRLSSDSAAWAAQLEALRAFHFDVVAVDLPGGEGEWAAAALDIASVAFILWPEGSLEPAHEAGIRWHLHVTRSADDALEWSLDPLDKTNPR